MALLQQQEVWRDLRKQQVSCHTNRNVILFFKWLGFSRCVGVLDHHCAIYQSIQLYYTLPFLLPFTTKYLHWVIDSIYHFVDSSIYLLSIHYWNMYIFNPSVFHSSPSFASIVLFHLLYLEKQWTHYLFFFPYALASGWKISLHPSFFSKPSIPNTPNDKFKVFSVPYFLNFLICFFDSFLFLPSHHKISYHFK